MRWQHVRRAALGLVGLQTVGLVGVSTLFYNRFMESVDFGIFAQAFVLIGRGNLNPENTLKRGSFLTSHFELIMWPLSLLSWVTPGGLGLLWIQALALGGCGLVVVAWSARLLEARGLTPRWGAVALGGVVIMVVANQVFWRTVAEDFHFQALAGLLILLAARDLIDGRERRMWLMVSLCLLCGDVAALLVVGLGITGLLTQGRRRTGVLVVVAGAAWLGLVGLIGANHASHLRDYSSLAGTTLHPGLSGLVHLALGLVTHPGRAISLLAHRSDLLLANLRAGGIIGLVTPLGLGAPVIVLASAGLESHVDYVRAGFQLVPAIPLLLVGSVMALLWGSRRLSGRGPLAARLAAAAGLVLVVSSLGLSASPSSWLLTSSANPTMISPVVARGLDAALAATPADAQVIAQAQVVGRFSARRHVEWAFFGAPRRLPLQARQVVLVLLHASGTPENPTVTRLRHQGAKLLINADGVEAIEWHPPTGRQTLLVAP